MVLHEHRVSLGIHHLVGVDAKSFHVTVTRRNAARREQVGQHMHGFRGLRHEVEDAVRLLPEGHRVRLQGMDDIRELDGITDKEDRQVVANQVPISVFGIKLDRKTAGIASDFRGVATADNGREPNCEWRPFARLLEQLGSSIPGGRLVADFAGRLELTVTDETARMDDALGNAFAVEMGDLFEELVVLQRGRAAGTHGALRLVVGDRVALPVGQDAVAGALMHTIAAM